MKSIPDPAPAIFLDRDGVINRKLPEDRYVAEIAELELLPGAPSAIATFRAMGLAVVIVTNQRGIARGLMTEQQLLRVHEHLRALLEHAGGAPDGIYYCPHETFEGCGCRKPEPGMILSAAKELNLDLNSSIMVGDSPSDIEAGRRAGTATCRIAPEPDPAADLTFPDLMGTALCLKDRIHPGNVRGEMRNLCNRLKGLRNSHDH
jgi:D-glycero-D-manno-heptose 1,7-bisphosphate phosphatase